MMQFVLSDLSKPRLGENLFMVQSKAIITSGYGFICNNMIHIFDKVCMYLHRIMGKRLRINGPDSFITSDILYGSLHQLALAHYLDERHFSTVTAQEGKNTT